MPSARHEESLAMTLRILKENGFRTIDLRKLPDAIAFREGKIYAVEVLPEKHGYGTSLERGKQSNYEQFDDTIFAYYRPQSTTIRFPDSLRHSGLPWLESIGKKGNVFLRRRF